jgi:hypothetical protein
MSDISLTNQDPAKKCVSCGAELKGRRDARFCSDRCRQAAHRKTVADKQSSPPSRERRIDRPITDSGLDFLLE